jgi:hypothetical protein
VSVTWNVAYDAGIAAGGLGFGLIIGSVGYSAALVGAAAATALLLTPMAGYRKVLRTSTDRQPKNRDVCETSTLARREKTMGDASHLSLRDSGKET